MANNFQRSFSNSRFSTDRSRAPSSLGMRSHSPSPTPSEGTPMSTVVVVGVCAMDVKARSKPMREIITRLVERGRGSIEVKLFGEQVILGEGVLRDSLVSWLEDGRANDCGANLQTWRIGRDAIFLLVSSVPTFPFSKLSSMSSYGTQSASTTCTLKRSSGTGASSSVCSITSLSPLPNGSLSRGMVEQSWTQSSWRS